MADLLPSLRDARNALREAVASLRGERDWRAPDAPGGKAGPRQRIERVILKLEQADDEIGTLDL